MVIREDFNDHGDEGNRSNKEVLGRFCCQGKEPGMTDCKMNGNSCGEYLLQKKGRNQDKI